LAGGAGAFTGLVIAYNTSGGPKYTPEIFAQSLPTLNTLGVFSSGVALRLIFCFGLWLVVGGTKTHRAPQHPQAGPWWWHRAARQQRRRRSSAAGVTGRLPDASINLADLAGRQHPQ
jgi:hypothetical protein